MSQIVSYTYSYPKPSKAYHNPTNVFSSTSHRYGGQRSLHNLCCLHGLFASFQHLGEIGFILACELSICWIHGFTYYDIIQYGWLHSSLPCQRHDLVSLNPPPICSDRSAVPNLLSSAYCWGNFAGPFVVKPSQAPHFTGATIGLLVGYAIKLACHLLLLSESLNSDLPPSIS